MEAVTEELASTCMFRNRMIWLAVIPPLKRIVNNIPKIRNTFQQFLSSLSP